MDKSYMDDKSDAVSGISQDRLSDDTDFLIGHNVSLRNLNDSYIDDRSSTTTDLLYQQQINDAEVGVKKLTSPIKFTTNSPSPIKDTKLETNPKLHAKSRDIFIKEEFYNTNQAFVKEKQPRFGNGDSHMEEAKPKDNSRIFKISDYQVKEDSANKTTKDQTSSDDAKKSSDALSISRSSKNSSTNWKYRSVDVSLDEDSVAETRNANLKNESFSESLTADLPGNHFGFFLLLNFLALCAYYISFVRHPRAFVISSTFKDRAFKGILICKGVL